jgi:hypothetical protein
MELWQCEAGHLTTHTQPDPGAGDGPPFHCPYPCMEPLHGPTVFIEEFFVIHAPGWPGGIAPTPNNEERARQFVEENGGTLRRRWTSPWRDDK